MPSYALDKRPPAVARCRVPGHRRHKPGCATCKAYSNYYRLLLRWERSVGINRGIVPAEPVRQHLADLLENGNRMQWDIAEESGYGRDLIALIVGGHRKSVMASTADVLLAIKPRIAPRPPQGNWVPSCEGRRTLRGLAAQGWTNPTIGDLMGGTTTHAAQKMMNDPSPWMLTETLDRIRAVARVLGDKDIRNGKLPGMDVRCMNNAIRRGWAPLWAWKGRDITDPDAQPIPFTASRPVDDELDSDEPATSELEPFVDPVLLTAVRGNAQRLDTIRSQGGRPDDLDDDETRRALGWVDPLPALTRLEKYVVVAYGTQLGMSLAETAALIGYPHGTKDEIRTAQRSASRIRVVTNATKKWIDSDPAGEIPDWWREATTTSLFDARVPALMAMLPAPIGPHWGIEELAKRVGVTEDEMREFVARALPAADRPWRVQVGEQVARAA